MKFSKIVFPSICFLGLVAVALSFGANLTLADVADSEGATFQRPPRGNGGRKLPKPPGPDKTKADIKKNGLMGARYPSVSPDGKSLAFALNGDLWVMPVEGGRAQRLTLNEANDVKPVWSPDGKKIAFTSDRSGSFDVWLMNADGGTPSRITYDGGTDHVCQFSADGRSLYFQSTRMKARWNIFQVPVNGGTPKCLTVDGSATAASISPVDGTIFYQYSISDSKRKGYRGSANDDIYFCKPGKIPTRLTRNDLNDRNPHISPDGKTVYFTRESGVRGRTYNLYSMDVETREENQITELDDNGIGYLCFNKDYTKAYFTWRFRLHSVDLTSSDSKAKLIKVRIVEDTRRDKMIQRTRTNGATGVDISADGRMITFTMGGSIWVMNASGGAAKRVTPAGSSDQHPRLSPDGKRIAFFSASRSGNADLFLVNVNGKGLKQLTSHKTPDHFHNWSPDGQYLVFASDRAGKRDIWRVGVDGSSPVQLTNTPRSDDDPSVSPDGKFIAFDSQRSGNADLYIMNADGTKQRRIYGTLAHEESPRFSPNGRLLVFSRSNPNSRSKRVVVTDLAGSGEVAIGVGSDGSFTPDGKHIVYVDARGEIKKSPAPTAISGGETIPFIAVEKVDQGKQFVQAFDQAWGLVNANFYMRNFHGSDWQAMRAKYRPLIENCQTRMEFYYFMTELIGELSASHQGINGQVTETLGYATGSLGAELVPEIMKRDDDDKRKGPPLMRLRVVKPEKGSPADKAWIREGDYIFGVENQRLTKNVNFFARMNNTVGKDVKLLVGSKPDGSDIRVVTVKPENGSAARGRRYVQWVSKCKKTTREESDASVAYIHIPAMNPQSLQKFQNELGSRNVQMAKALVLDVRNNGGGNIHQQLIDILSRRHYANMFNRVRPKIPAPNLYWDRPIVLLINKKSFSDAEVFPHAFKTLKLGTIVGVPTPGAVIGTNDLTLVDGSRFRVTSIGFRNLDGKNQEGYGCEPDVLVEETPEDRVKGNDVQLKKAIEIALEKIASGGGTGQDQPAKDPDELPAEDDEEDFSENSDE